MLFKRFSEKESVKLASPIILRGSESNMSSLVRYSYLSILTADKSDIFAVNIIRLTKYLRSISDEWLNATCWVLSLFGIFRIKYCVKYSLIFLEHKIRLHDKNKTDV